MQVFTGQCVKEFLPRPELTPKFNGVVAQIPRATCLGKELSRRQDGLVPRFGSSTPSANSTKLDIFGLALHNPALAYQVVPTTEGSVKLPLETQKVQYLPTGEVLDFLSHSQGTRLQPLPARYYSR